MINITTYMLTNMATIYNQIKHLYKYCKNLKYYIASI